jgi:hypothetical protein
VRGLAETLRSLFRSRLVEHLEKEIEALRERERLIRAESRQREEMLINKLLLAAGRTPGRGEAVSQTEVPVSSLLRSAPPSLQKAREAARERAIREQQVVTQDPTLKH